MNEELKLFTAQALIAYVMRKYTGAHDIQTGRDFDNAGIEVTIKAPTPIQLIIEVILSPEI